MGTEIPFNEFQWIRQLEKPALVCLTGRYYLRGKPVNLEITGPPAHTLANTVAIGCRLSTDDSLFRRHTGIVLFDLSVCRHSSFPAINIAAGKDRCQHKQGKCAAWNTYCSHDHLDIATSYSLICRVSLLEMLTANSLARIESRR